MQVLDLQSTSVSKKKTQNLAESIFRYEHDCGKDEYIWLTGGMERAGWGMKLRG
jgi:hypothetical protein